MWQAIVYASLVGFVSAGFAGSAWAMVAGQPPDLATMSKRDILLPLRVMAGVLHFPILMLRHGAVLTSRRLGLGLAALAAGGGWCFLQGVFILTVIFRIG